MEYKGLHKEHRMNARSALSGYGNIIICPGSPVTTTQEEPGMCSRLRGQHLGQTVPRDLEDPTVEAELALGLHTGLSDN